MSPTEHLMGSCIFIVCWGISHISIYNKWFFFLKKERVTSQRWEVQYQPIYTTSTTQMIDSVHTTAEWTHKKPSIILCPKRLPKFALSSFVSLWKRNFCLIFILRLLENLFQFSLVVWFSNAHFKISLQLPWLSPFSKLWVFMKWGKQERQQRTWLYNDYTMKNRTITCPCAPFIAKIMQRCFILPMGASPKFSFLSKRKFKIIFHDIEWKLKEKKGHNFSAEH